MDCKYCGAPLNENALFCGQCGQKTDGAQDGAQGFEQFPQHFETDDFTVAQDGAQQFEPMPQTDDFNGFAAEEAQPSPVGKRKKPLFITAAVVAAAVIFACFNIFAKDPKSYALNAVKTSQVAYAREIGDLFKKNPVLSALLSGLKESNAQKFKIADGQGFICRDDKKNKRLSLELEAEYLDLGFPIKLILTNDRLYAGADGVVFVEADPKRLGGDVITLINNTGIAGDINFDFEQLARALNDYDFSYDSVMSENFAANSPETKEIISVYKGWLTSLLNRAQVEKQKGAVLIGGDSVKTDLITMTISAAVLNDWLTKDVLAALKKSSALQKYYDVCVELNSYYWYGPETFGDLLDELEESAAYLAESMEDAGAQIIVDAQVYKGVIVSLKFSLSSEGGEDASLTLSALGEDYRLSDIKITVDNGYNPVTFSAKGDYFNKDAVEAVFSYSSLDDSIYDGQRLSMRWDLNKTANNLKFEIDGDVTEMTFARAADGVLFEYDDGYDAVMYRLSYSDAAVDLPGNTTAAQSFNMQDFLDLMPVKNYQTAAAQTTCAGNLRILASCQAAYYAMHQTYAQSAQEFVDEKLIPPDFACPTAKNGCDSYFLNPYSDDYFDWVCEFHGGSGYGEQF